MSDAARADALESARTPTAILAEVVRAVWAKLHKGADCPPDAIPTPDRLAAAVALRELPVSAMTEGHARLSAMLGAGAGWTVVYSPDPDGEPIARWFPDKAPDPDNPWSRKRYRPVVLALDPGKQPHTIEAVHAEWRALSGDLQPAHPLAPLGAACFDLPREVEPERRRDRRILPRMVAGDDPPEREAGMLFGGLHEGRRVETPELPLWAEVAPVKRVPILDLVDAAGVPVMARGPGVPLPLRLFVRALVSVCPADRKLKTARLALTLRELRDGLFPKGWRIGNDWPRLRDALLHARDYAVHDGAGRWFPVALRYMPDAPKLDDVVVLDIAFPRGSHSGPTVALPAMDRLSVESAPRWRAHIAAHSVAWQPGTTRVPVPQCGRFAWARDLAAYPVLTLADRRRFAFGFGDGKHRTRAEIDVAFRDLPGLVVVSESASNDRTGEVGWIVIPDLAAEAVRKAMDDE